MRLSAYGITSLLVALGLACSCSVLPTPEPVAMNQYVLEYTPGHAATGPVDDVPVLIVTAPRAHGGYASKRIAYMKQEFGLRYYTRSRWADTPSRMLAPLLADAMQTTGQFQALYAVPGSIAADYRLDTELIRFHQDFTQQPSAVHLSLRARLVDLQDSRVVATRQFDIVEPAATDDSYGGVVAANSAVSQLLDELAQFCVSKIAAHRGVDLTDERQQRVIERASIDQPRAMSDMLKPSQLNHAGRVTLKFRRGMEAYGPELFSTMQMNHCAVVRGLTEYGPLQLL